MYIIKYENDEFLEEVMSFDDLDDAKVFVNTLRVDVRYKIYKIEEVEKYLVLERFEREFDDSYRQMVEEEDVFVTRAIAVMDSKPSEVFLRGLASRGLEKLRSNPRAAGEKTYDIYNSEDTFGAYCEYGKNFFKDSYEYFVKSQNIFVEKEVQITL